MSKLRKKWTRFDVRNAQVLRFARAFHGEKFKFLTLTTTPQEDATLRARKQILFRKLRCDYPGIEYRCTSTNEGFGVSHLCLVCSAYIPWRKITALWGAHVWISQEKSLEKLLSEMSLQSDHRHYSMSRKFLPDGAVEAIEALGRRFRGKLGMMAVEMLGMRWNRDNAFERTVECCSRKLGWRSDIRSKREYLGGRS